MVDESFGKDQLNLWSTAKSTRTNDDKLHYPNNNNLPYGISVELTLRALEIPTNTEDP